MHSMHKSQLHFSPIYFDLQNSSYRPQHVTASLTAVTTDKLKAVITLILYHLPSPPDLTRSDAQCAAPAAVSACAAPVPAPPVRAPPPLAAF